MPKLHRGSHAPYEAIVGIVGHGLGKLDYSYRNRCYGDDELQFRVRTAAYVGPAMDNSSTELRKLGLAGKINAICPDCFTEVSCSNDCCCSDAKGYAHTTKFADGKVYSNK